MWFRENVVDWMRQGMPGAPGLAKARPEQAPLNASTGRRGAQFPMMPRPPQHPPPPGAVISQLFHEEGVLPFPPHVLPFPSEAANHIASCLLPPGSLPAVPTGATQPATIEVTVPPRPGHTVTIPVNLPPHVPPAEDTTVNPPSNPAEPNATHVVTATEPAEPTPTLDSDLPAEPTPTQYHDTPVYTFIHHESGTVVQQFDAVEQTVTQVDSSDDGTAAGAIHLSYIHCIALS